MLSSGKAAVNFPGRGDSTGFPFELEIRFRVCGTNRVKEFFLRPDGKTRPSAAYIAARAFCSVTKIGIPVVGNLSKTRAAGVVIRAAKKRACVVRDSENRLLLPANCCAAQCRRHQVTKGK